MCQFPRTIKTHVPDKHGISTVIEIKVPCGKCLDCLKRRCNDWCFRLEQEAKDWKYCSFITLTYDDANLPIVQYDSSGREYIAIGRRNAGKSTLYKKDLQKFFKRLRYKKYGVLQFKYFAVGEYGYNGTIRPHYHILLFHNRIPSYQLFNTIQTVWSKGRITCNRATNGRIHYCAKYCSFMGFSASQRCQRPYMVCSLRSPIGWNWLHTASAQKCFEEDKTVITKTHVTKSGESIAYKIALPRFYRRWLGMSSSYEDIREYMEEEDYKDKLGLCPPKHMTRICGELDVTVEYERNCYRAYQQLVESHKYRDYEQHIKFSYQTWLTLLHQSELQNRVARRTRYHTLFSPLLHRDV